jgi:hypothetical protein
MLILLPLVGSPSQQLSPLSETFEYLHNNVRDLEVEHDVVVEHVKSFETRRAHNNDATNSHQIEKRAGAHSIHRAYGVINSELPNSNPKTKRVTNYDADVLTLLSPSFCQHALHLAPGRKLCPPSPTPRCATLPRALTWLSIHTLMTVVSEPVADSSKACMTASKSLYPRIGPNWFLTRFIRLVGRSDVPFWAPSEAGACWRAKTRYLSFDVRVLLNGV